MFSCSSATIVSSYFDSCTVRSSYLVAVHFAFCFRYACAFYVICILVLMPETASENKREVS